jgi:hypothetical protein
MNISQLIEAFNSMVFNTQELCSSLKTQDNRIWVPLSEDDHSLGLTALQKAQQHYQDFWYVNGQDGRETRSCFGLISASDEQIETAKTINQQKDELKALFGQLQKHDKKEWLELKGQLGKQRQTLRHNLKLSGLNRLHLKQTWRHIPITQRTPCRVGFNWYSSGRSIQKVSVQQAFDALNQLDVSSKHVQTQLSMLSKLSNNTPLAKVQNLAPTMRANLFYKDDVLPARHAFNISLPILFKAGPEGSFPEHNEPELNAPIERKRAIRSDRKIEDNAFLPSLRIHRYCES